MTLLDQVAGSQLKVLRPSGGCHSCPRKRIDMVSANLVDGPIIWLGEAPGEKDVAEQDAFAGEGGQLLRKAATQAGVPGPWSYTYATHCASVGESLDPKA